MLLCFALGAFGFAPRSVPGDGTLADPPPSFDNPPPGEDETTIDIHPPAFPSPGLSASPPILHTIRLKSRQFQPSVPDAQSLQGLARLDRDRLHVLVQLDFIPRQLAKAELEAQGLELLAYVPDYAWIASVPAANPADVLHLPGVVWAGELTVDDKLDPAIVANQWAPYNLTPDGTVAVYVALHKDEGLDTGRKLVEMHGGKVTGEVRGINTLIAEMPQANVRALAAEEAVQWIEPASPPLGEVNDGIRAQIGVDSDALRRTLTSRLVEVHGIEHSTLQLESDPCNHGGCASKDAPNQSPAVPHDAHGSHHDHD